MAARHCFLFPACVMALVAAITLVLVGVADAVKLQSAQAETLLFIIKELNSTSPMVFESWKITTECADWTGVACDSSGNVISLVLTDVNNKVIHPNGTVLAKGSYSGGNLLTGTLSTRIAELEYLHTLVISGESITGPIPSTVGRLANLSILDLHANTLYGEVPKSIGNLSNLIYLDLSRNVRRDAVFNIMSSLNGTLPMELGQLGKLQYFDIHGCSFSGSPAFLKNLASLMYFDIAKNPFTGSLGDILGDFTQLLSLSLDLKDYTFDVGGFPTAITTYLNLQSLSLRGDPDSRRYITGDVPPSIGNLIQLMNLDLSGNKLTSIPSNISALTKLSYLNLADNELTSIDFWMNLPSLEILKIQRNGMTGALPDISTSKKLTSLEAQGNFFDGAATNGIPVWLGGLTNLNDLNLDFNNFGGQLPPSLANLTFLSTLSCAHCGLEGPIPQEIGNMAALSRLDLMYNSLTSNIPDVFGNLKSLRYLDLSRNRLTGTLPDSLKTAPSLNALYLNNNKLSGNISNGLNHNLLTLLLYSNNFTGPLPPEIGKLEGLIMLQLQDNQLSSEIPTLLWNLPVYLIDLSGNPFGRTFPEGVEKANLTLRSLLLSNCGLTGELLTKKIGILTNLVSLDLSNNDFSGPLPSLKALTNLKNLNLANNQFTISNLGNILPNSSLEKLDLGGLGFFLDGLPIFPEEYYKGLLTLSLPSNRISGELSATFLSKFEKLQAVYLQNNELYGDVGPIVNLPNSSIIEYINLMYNELTMEVATLPSTNIILDLAGNPLCFNKSLGEYCDESSGSLDYYESTTCKTTTCWADTKPKPTDCSCAGYFEMQLSFGYSPFAYISRESMRLLDIYLRKLTDNNTVLVDVVTANVTKLVWTITITYTVRLFSLDGLNIDPLYARKLTSIRVEGVGKIASVEGIGDLNYLTISPLVPYVSPPPPPLTPGSLTRSKSRKEFTLLVAIFSVVGGIIFVTTVSLVVYFCCLREKESMLEIKVGEGFVKGLPLPDIRRATNNFSDENLVGVGGYGFVYKGHGPNGELWAVKRAKTISLKGLLEFEQEVSKISQLRHTNIVKLLGFCDRKNEQILVYEFMSNGSLRNMLQPEKDSKAPALTFKQRVDIAVGAAEGLLYLHKYAHTALIHRDIKSDNILLDQNLTAKVGDFGLVKDNPSGSAEEALKTRVAGTPGYIDPEYFTNYQVTAKSDVYSFGVVLLELITGKAALIKEDVSDDADGPSLTTLPNWVQPYLADIAPVVDPRMGPYNELAMSMLVKLATVCIERAARYRPNMDEVARRLGQIKNVLLGVSEMEMTHSIEESDDFSNRPAALTRNLDNDLNPLAPISGSYDAR